MNSEAHESKIPKQVNSRSTKPDESRQKSLYFLLLAIGRQRAASKPSLRMEYREALNSLEINRIDESWEISLKVGDKEVSRKILRNEFKFYSTGLTQNEDKIVESNKIKANSFWDFFESEVFLDSNTVFNKKQSLMTRVSKVKFFGITQTLQIICIFITLIPTSIKTLPYLFLALFPIVRLYWHSSRRMLFLFLYASLTTFFALTMNFENISSIFKGESFLPVLLIFLLWSEIYRIRYQAHKSHLRSFTCGLLVVGITLYCLLSPSNDYFYLSACLLIVFSEALQLLRRRLIQNSVAVAFTSMLEIIASLCLGVFFLKFGFNTMEFSGVEVLFFTFAYLSWFIYLNIYERYVFSFRAFYPFLLLLTVTNQNYNFETMTISLIILSVVIAASANKNSRSQKYE